MYLKAAVGAILVSVLGTGLASAQVVWSDEFNGDRIDSEIWTHDVGGHGFGNGQLEYDTARKENSYIEDGKLVLEARREDYAGKSFTSARMLTQGRFAFQYGILEARIKLPHTADGVWPAFWMLGENFPAIEWPKSGEIDIVEMGSQQGIAEGLQQRRINCALHFADPEGEHEMKVAWLDAEVDLNRDYHIYKVSWTPSHLKFYLDDVEFGAWEITADPFREFHQPYFPILNLAIGGWDSAYTGVTSPEAVTAPFPARMYVDWIRLTKNPHTKIYLGSDREETGNFGVFTETTPVKNSLHFNVEADAPLEYGDAAALYVWNNMTSAGKSSAADVAQGPDCSEGAECWSFDVTPGSWFGMGVFVPSARNMKNYSDGILHFDVKSTSKAPIRVGIKSRVGESSLPLGDESAEFGFARDGKWHEVTIPLNRYKDVDFHTIHQLFMIAGDPPESAMNLSVDDVWWQPSH